jgi:hypothetical protein
MGMVSAYPALVVGVAFGDVVTVWCLNRSLWHPKELKPLERFKIFVGGLVGAGILAGPVQKAPDPYVGILVVGLLLGGMVGAGMMEAKLREALSFPSPDNGPSRICKARW